MDVAYCDKLIYNEIQLVNLLANNIGMATFRQLAGWEWAPARMNQKYFCDKIIIKDPKPKQSPW